MANGTPFFEAFGPLLFGRRPKSALAKLQRVDSLQDLYALFGDLLPGQVLAPTKKGVNSRVRCLSLQVIFWAFLAQVLQPNSACRDIVRKVEAWWRWAKIKRPPQALSTSAYCQARARLAPATLQLIAAQLVHTLHARTLPSERWLQGREVKIADGTNLSMPDTPENQALWPQPSGQAVGLGFPMLKLCGLFSLSSGALLDYTTGNQHVRESLLLRQMWNHFSQGDILLADRAYCSFAALASLQARGVDSVVRLHQARRIDFRRGKSLGPDDRLIEWHKPEARTSAWSEAEFAALPENLSLRLIRLHVRCAGFRTRSVVLVTTLLDAELYPAEKIRALYAERWGVELHFFQIKTLLALDVLRCKTPAMIEREVAMHLIAYNLVRVLMQRAAHEHRVALSKLSFKGTLDTTRHFADTIHAAAATPRLQQALIDQMLSIIAGDPVPARPHRSEPRAVKRRRKNYQLLTKPRPQSGNLPHRNRPKSTTAPKTT